MLTNIPGISSNYAIAILNIYKNINNLLTFINNSDTDEDKKKVLENIIIKSENGKERRLGPKLSIKLLEYLRL